MRLASLSLFGALLAYLYYTGWPLLHRRLVVLGVLRHYSNDSAVKDQVVVISDTVHCEDLHYHAPSGMLFTACEDNIETRFKWFPALPNFDDPELASKSQGSIHVIDPKSMTSRRLKFTNFPRPFITHGIDIIPDPSHPSGPDAAIYLLAVNHLPNPSFSPSSSDPLSTRRARSQLELFHYVLGTSTVRHVRSIWHPLIRTPNDIFAESVTSMYVTNDHKYAEHGVMRSLEDLYAGARWTEVVHLQVNSLEAKGAGEGVTASVALPNIHNCNGLGHGREESEILVASCTGGVLHIGRVSPTEDNNNLKGDKNITLIDAISIDHIVDNPAYFSDPYATSPADDKSGFVLAGLGKAIDLSKTMRDITATEPVIVTYVTKNASNGGKWEKRVLFEDDGTKIRTASAAVLVPVDPKEEKGGKGERKAWLFVTGFLSKSVVAVKVDL